MKKKILSFLMAICLALPFGLSLTACDKDKDSTDPPPAKPTTAEMIDVLQDAVKLTNYQGKMQHVHVNKTNTTDYTTVSQTKVISTEYKVRKEDGSFVYYTIENTKPDKYTGTEYIKHAGYVEKVGNDWQDKVVDLDDYSNATKTELKSIYNVGENYSQNRILNSIDNYIEYLYDIKNEETMTTVLQNILDQHLPRFQALAASKQDNFTYNKTDIVVTSNISESDGTYKATGTIVLPSDKITHTNESPSPDAKMYDFEVEFEIVYTSEMLIRNYSKFIYRLDKTPADTTDALTEFYIINDDTFSTTIDNDHFTKIKTIIDNSATLAPEDRNETIRFIVNGKNADFRNIKFGTNIKETVNDWIGSNVKSKSNCTYKVYLDEAQTIEYQADAGAIIADFIGAEIYVEITANENYAVVVTSYYTGNPYEGYQYDNFEFEVVAKDDDYSIVYNGYNHIVLINEVQQQTPPNTITLTENEYLIDMFKIVL